MVEGNRSERSWKGYINLDYKIIDPFEMKRILDC